MRSFLKRTRLGHLPAIVLILALITSCGDEAQFQGHTAKKSLSGDQVALKQDDTKSQQSGDAIGQDTEILQNKDVQNLEFELSQKSSRKIILEQSLAPKDETTTIEVAQNDKKLDLLVVIDTSGSMREEQQNLKNKLLPLVDSIGNADWQIAVVTTNQDMSENCFRDLITPNQKDAKKKFADAVDAGTWANGEEMGFRNAVIGLNAECPGQKPWIREGSFVSVLIVSDEDDCSGQVCPDGKPWHDLYAKKMQELRAKNRTRTYGILTTPQSRCAGAHQLGEKYINVINSFEGKVGDICDKDYTHTLRAISDDLALMLNKELEFEGNPDPDSLKVLVNGNSWTGFEYLEDSNKVVFTDIPPPKSHIVVTYEPSVRLKDAVSILVDQHPDLSTLEVTLNDETIDSSDYQLTLTDKGYELEFEKVVLEASLLRVSYDSKVEKTEQFEIAKGLDVLELQAFAVDETSIPEFDISYDKDRGTITFDPPLPVDSKVLLKVKASK